MTSATLAILVLIAVGAIAGLVLYILLPPTPSLTPEQAINNSIVAPSNGPAISVTSLRCQ